MNTNKVENILNHKRNMALLVFVCILCLLPFSNKAFHIDDPVYIWVAKHIQTNILDFHGFSINWTGVERPLSSNINPPLLSYYLALVAYWFGWDEFILHMSLLIPACAVIIGTYLLAQELCTRPLIAALICLSTPVFMVSSTTVMPDVLMLSFWVFSVFFWRRGIKQNNVAQLFVASVLISVCCLTKYIGMNLIPLLFAYSLAERRRFGSWTVILIIPILLLGGFNWITYQHYDNGQIANAGSFALFASNASLKTFISGILTGLAFVGGCLLAPFLNALIVWRRGLLISFLFITSLLLLLLSTDLLASYPIANADGINWLFVVQLPVFVVAGVSFMYFTVTDFYRSRDSDSLLLFLWVIGSLIFAVFINWTINGRSILPMVPVTGIIVMRYWDRIEIKGAIKNQWYIYATIIPTTLVAILVNLADYRWANSSQAAAIKIHNSYKDISAKLWFEGHFGFQYYMQELGGSKAIDFEKPDLKIDDIVVIPSNNSYFVPIHKHMALVVDEFRFNTLKYFSTMNIKSGAGFYSSRSGPLPYSISSDTAEKYFIYKMIIDKNTCFIF